MSQRKKIIPTLKELKEDLKGMTFAEKVDHLWTYYKEVLLVIGLVALLVFATVSSIQNLSKNIVSTGVYANITMTPAGMRYMKDGFAEHLGVDNIDDVVEVNYTNFSSLVDPGSSENNYTAAQVLVSLVTAGRMDYALLDKLALEFYITQEVFLDLREFFTPEQLQELEDKDMLVYLQPGELDENGKTIEDSLIEEERYPIAVKLKDTQFCKDAMYGKDVYFCVGGHDPNLENTRKLWDYMMNWK